MPKAADPSFPSRRRRQQRRLLRLLMLLTMGAMLQRALLAWLPPRPIQPPPLHPDDVELTLLPLHPARVSSGDFQVAALVSRHAPGWALGQRRLLHTSGGNVAVGVLPDGRAALQTCLMASGSAAVSFGQMRAQVLHTMAQEPQQRLQAAIAAVVMGRPLHQRGCLLVLLRSRSPVAAESDRPGFRTAATTASLPQPSLEAQGAGSTETEGGSKTGSSPIIKVPGASSLLPQQQRLVQVWAQLHPALVTLLTRIRD